MCNDFQYGDFPPEHKLLKDRLAQIGITDVRELIEYAILKGWVK